jgi:hypothetical protein
METSTALLLPTEESLSQISSLLRITTVAKLGSKINVLNVQKVSTSARKESAAKFLNFAVNLT